MALIKAGVWHTTVWASQLWQEDLWLEYGTAVPPTITPVSGDAIWLRTRKKEPFKPLLSRELKEALVVWLQTKKED